MRLGKLLAPVLLGIMCHGIINLRGKFRNSSRQLLAFQQISPDKMGLFLPPWRGNEAPLERILAISRNLQVPITRVGLDASISKPRAVDRAATRASRH
jgi:hypothetical protein